ncbi:hypothetical protein N480_13345 [Pseudoalteromonas luteoviolacea S2607]|uniref:DUF1496 domain-containing protein n=1 Tax=Pseudoalteromonas luteoviolacea TaxID=43657 RepID=UPI0007B07485|nr:DUF1496 domain-containing protein [Pseudoalteromonas luteoviolacea]KZN38634.1 hypothetical protein N480_13345 [Pseudoalteromonas luteoviolacea S2607]
MYKINFLAFLILFLFINPINAKEPSPRIFVDAPERVCWFNSSKYSEGSIIKQFDQRYICSHRYANQPDSPLVWLQMNKQGEIKRLDLRGKIRVH